MYDSRVHKNKTIYIVMEEFNMLNFIRRNAKILAIIVILFVTTLIISTLTLIIQNKAVTKRRKA